MRTLLHGRTEPREPVGTLGGLPKRVMDIALSLFGFVLFFPLFIMVAALVRAMDGGPVLISHNRVGENGRTFGCLKFRTMVVGADKVLERHLQCCPAAAQEWAETHKLKHDPRVTALGAVLRKASLDELPQLLNVLRGEMSVVGPRPIVIDELGKYGSDLRFYLRARPGITGLWQVGGRNDEGYESRVRLDRVYVEKWAFRRDMFVVLKTVPAVLSARGSY